MLIVKTSTLLVLEERNLSGWGGSRGGSGGSFEPPKPIENEIFKHKCGF